MRKLALLLLAATLSISAARAQGATQSDFDAAYQAAMAAEQRAGALGNQWMPTEAALKAAKKAADAKDYGQAVAWAHHAQALAEASIAQAKEQDKVWQKAVVK